MFLNLLHLLFIGIEVIILFNLLILVHELGHFLAAKWRGMKVERFSIWFGKPLWKKKIDGVEYCLGTIPAGGYVALPQMADMQAVEGKSDVPQEVLPPASPLDKIIVAFAGPLFSFGLALLFAVIVWTVGRPVNEREAARKVGYIDTTTMAGREAEKAGLQLMDEIIEIDGHPIKKFYGMGASINWRIVTSEGDTIHMKVKRGDQIVPVDMKATSLYEKKAFWQRKALREVPFLPADSEVRIDGVVPNGPAAAAGLQKGDLVVALDGKPLYSTAAVSMYLAANPNAVVPLTIRRGDQELTRTLVPEVPIEPKDVQQPMLGIAWTPHLRIIHPSPWEQITASVDAVISTMQAVLAPRTDVNASHMQGPLGIMNVMAILFQSPEGWRQALWLAVLINVNLAIVNLLPLPVLDGGHILLAVIEAIRRKPINVKVLELIQSGCAMLIIGFMLYVSFFDVQDFRLPFSRPEIKFAPKNLPSN